MKRILVCLAAAARRRCRVGRIRPAVDADVQVAVAAQRAVHEARRVRVAAEALGFEPTDDLDFVADVERVAGDPPARLLFGGDDLGVLEVLEGGAAGGVGDDDELGGDRGVARGAAAVAPHTLAPRGAAEVAVGGGDDAAHHDRLRLGAGDRGDEPALEGAPDEGGELRVGLDRALRHAPAVRLEVPLAAEALHAEVAEHVDEDRGGDQDREEHVGPLKGRLSFGHTLTSMPPRGRG
jgi:hypothetical protein